jgi:hypothetical protein
VLALRLLPPLSPAAWTQRLLSLSLRDLRRLAMRPSGWTTNEWDRILSRLIALPDQAEPLQRAWLAAALTVGTGIIRLRNLATEFNVGEEADCAFGALARRDSVAAAGRLAQIDRLLGDETGDGPAAQRRLRARAGILAMREALTEYGAYFDTDAAR